MMRPRAYLVLALLACASALAGLVLSWTALGRQFDNYAYDFLFRLEQPAPWQPASVILAIDEETLTKYGGVAGMRGALAAGLRHIQQAKPAAVAVDLILADATQADDQLEQALAGTRNLVLSSDLAGGWEDPIDRFRRHGVAIGHVHADLDAYDGISRDLPLEKASGRDRRWALALEAYRAAQSATVIESPDDLTVGAIRIPSSVQNGRVMRIRYTPVAMNGIPRISVAELDRDPSLAARFAGKTVFAGVTAQTAVRDRWMTPYSNSVAMPGIEMHANAWETIARRMFLTDVPLAAVVLACFLFAAAAAAIYALTSGWIASVLAVALVGVSQLLPALAFDRSLVWPWLPATCTAVVAIAASAAWRHLWVRRELDRAEREKTRYQSAMQFVTHEMRTPLTAIQGSSELISRYGSMPEDKRKQMAELINAESKRLARMIETFLSAERLSAGEMDLKQERFPLADIVTKCTERARPLADRKEIEISVAPLPVDELAGDRELMEYVVYNLLTNAVKYSPRGTKVTIYGDNDKGDRVRLSVRDQGVGMDAKEVSRIFERFYRTKRAEQSGETGTGIGLSIVEQIVTRHGGTIHVESEPGRGSTFTLVLKRAQ